MSIIRGKRPKAQFYLLRNSIAADSRLSWGARGLLIFLLTKPDDWRVSVAHLVTQTAGARIASGRDAVYALLAELIEAGYIERRQAHVGGRLAEVEYVVHEDAAQHPANPEAVQLPGKQHPANPTLQITEVNQGQKNHTKTKCNENSVAKDRVIARRIEAREQRMREDMSAELAARGKCSGVAA